MQVFHLNRKRLSVWIILFLQIFLIASYIYTQKNLTNKFNTADRKVTFIRSLNTKEECNITYRTKNSRIVLRNINTRDSFTDFNTSLCFTNGTDLKLMNHNKDFNWVCECLPGWHGSNCAQPEIIWRAFLAYHKPIIIKGPRKYQRRIIYILYVNEYSQMIAEIKVNELKDLVDLFILYEGKREHFLERKLKSGFLKEHHRKILFLKVASDEKLWVTVRRLIKNLREDDIVLTSNLAEILNRKALEFFKFYDKWPQPVNFRLKWSVYGFFWLHPENTVLSGGACTVAYLHENLNNNVSLLIDNRTIVNPISKKSFIIGDLNHFGGWFCEYCNDPTQIINYLASKPSSDFLLERKQIDTAYIEELIENGVYIDGKMELRRAHRYQDNYYSPPYVSDNNWKYDNLLINLYSKLDYY